MFRHDTVSLVLFMFGCAIVALPTSVAVRQVSASKPEGVLQPTATQTDKNKRGQKKADVFGDPLPPGVVARMGSERLRHAGSVLNLLFTASGKLASTGHDATVRLWDGKTGKELLRLEAGRAFVKGLSVSRDEKLLAAGGDAIYIWDARTGKRLHRLQVVPKALTYSVAFSPDGSRLVSADIDHGIRLWDTASGKIVRTFTTEKTLDSRVAFSPDGKILAATKGTSIWLWDTATGKKLRQIQGHKSVVLALAFSPNGRTLATGSYDRTIRLWNVADGALIRALKGHDRQVLSVAFSPDGKKLASAGGDNLVRVWEIASGKERLQIRQGLGESVQNVYSVSYSPDGATLAAGSNYGRIRLWDAESGKEMQPPRGHDGCVTALAFSPDGKRLFSGDFYGAVIAWDAATGKQQHTYSRQCSRIFALALSPDGETLAAGCTSATFVWKTASGEEILQVPGLGTKVAFLSQARLLTSDGSRISKLWNLRTGKPIDDVPARVLMVDRKGYILHQKELSLYLFDATARRDKVEFKLPVSKPPFEEQKDGFWFNVATVNCAAVSPDGELLATVSQAFSTNNLNSDGFGAFATRTKVIYKPTIHLWKISTGKLVREILLPIDHVTFHGGINCLAFSPDGRTLAGGGYAFGKQRIPPAAVLFWDVATGKQVHKIQIPRLAGENPVGCLAFSPDGKTLATGGCDSTILVWQLPRAITTPTAKETRKPSPDSN